MSSNEPNFFVIFAKLCAKNVKRLILQTITLLGQSKNLVFNSEMVFQTKTPMGIYRETTMFRFSEEIEGKGKILVRAPPFCGKTAFAYLLWIYLNKTGRKAFYITFSQFSQPNNESFLKYWESIIGEKWTDQFIDPLNKIFILDETQRIYDDNLSFWGFFKNPLMKNSHLTLICFAGYGDQSTHFKINFDLAYGVNLLSFNNEEFEEIISKFTTTYNIDISQKTKQHLQHSLNNHCGLLKETFYFLETQTKNMKIQDPDELLYLLYSEEYIGTIRATKAIPSLELFPLDKDEKEMRLDVAIKREDNKEKFLVLDSEKQKTAKKLSKIGYFSEMSEYSFKIALLSNQIKHYYIPKEKVITVINKEVKYKNTCM